MRKETDSSRDPSWEPTITDGVANLQKRSSDSAETSFLNLPKSMATERDIDTRSKTHLPDLTDKQETVVWDNSSSVTLEEVFSPLEVAGIEFKLNDFIQTNYPGFPRYAVWPLFWGKGNLSLQAVIEDDVDEEIGMKLKEEVSSRVQDFLRNEAYGLLKLFSEKAPEEEGD